MEDPKWTEVLDMMYNDLRTLAGEDGKLRSIDHPNDDDFEYLLNEMEDVDKSEMADIIESMKSTGLLESFVTLGEEGEIHTIGLTSKGMEVAHERATQKQQRGVTKRTGVYTLFLVLAVSIQALTASITLPGAYSVGIGVIVLMLVLGVTYEFFSIRDW